MVPRVLYFVGVLLIGFAVFGYYRSTQPALAIMEQDRLVENALAGSACDTSFFVRNNTAGPISVLGFGEC